MRRRRPVAAKTALATAGTMAEVPGSPMPPGASRARHDVHLDGRRLVDTKHLVVIEVRLLDPSVLDGDLAIQGSGDAEVHAALDLRADGVRIDDRAAIDRRHDAADPHRLVGRYRDFGHQRQIAAEDGLQGNAPTRPRRQRLPQPAFCAASASTALARGALSSSASR